MMPAKSAARQTLLVCALAFGPLCQAGTIGLSANFNRGNSLPSTTFSEALMINTALIPWSSPIEFISIPLDLSYSGWQSAGSIQVVSSGASTINLSANPSVIPGAEFSGSTQISVGGDISVSASNPPPFSTDPTIVFNGSPVSGSSAGEGDTAHTSLKSISVDGDLFLDYSLFNNDGSATINTDSQSPLQRLVLTAGNSIQLMDDTAPTPALPDRYNTLNLAANENLELELSGDWLILPEAGRLSGEVTFTAEGSIYVGQYQHAIQPVPVPGALWLMLSGLGMVVLNRKALLDS